MLESLEFLAKLVKFRDNINRNIKNWDMQSVKIE